MLEIKTLLIVIDHFIQHDKLMVKVFLPRFYLIFLLFFSGCSKEAEVNKSKLGAVSIPVLKVFSCDSDSLTISDNAKIALMEAGMTQCMMPFGVLLSADQDMPSSYITLAGKILAEMLDQDMDGVIDDSLLIPYVSDWETGWLAMPIDYNKWENQQLPLLYNKLGYDIIIPSWWMDSLSPYPNTHSIAVMVEEIVHFLTQFGYSPLYPDQFGVENWSSIIAQETQRAQCDWWQHPENDCPDSPATIGGDCSDPNCDIVEFYQQVLILRVGMTPAWLGIGFPNSKEQLDQLLGQEIKEVMDNPIYHQLKDPLTFNYPLD